MIEVCALFFSLLGKVACLFLQGFLGLAQFFKPCLVVLQFFGKLAFAVLFCLILGFGSMHEFVDGLLKLLLFFLEFLVGSGLVTGGVGLDFGAVYGDLAHGFETELPRELEHFNEAFANELLVLPTKGANCVMIGMGVGGDVAHCNVSVGCSLDLARAGDPVAIAVDEQCQHHRGRILFATTTAMVMVIVVLFNEFYRVKDQMGDVVFGQPILKTWRK